jgi:hypothetical protein
VAKQAKAALALFTAPTSEDEKASEKAFEKEPAKKPSEKEKASKKTKEGAALAKHQLLNFATSTRPSTTRPLRERERQEQARSRCYQDV